MRILHFLYSEMSSLLAPRRVLRGGDLSEGKTGGGRQIVLHRLANLPLEPPPRAVSIRPPRGGMPPARALRIRRSGTIMSRPGIMLRQLGTSNVRSGIVLRQSMGT
jgi:hypothetical protein